MLGEYDHRIFIVQALPGLIVHVLIKKDLIHILHLASLFWCFGDMLTGDFPAIRGWVSGNVYAR